MARRHREGKHREPRAGCPLCFPESEPAPARLTSWATNAVDQVVRVAKRARTLGET